MLEDTPAVPATLVLKGALISGEAGRKWRRQLPSTVTHLIERWSLTIVAPFPELSYNYVAPVTRADGTAAVLKLWFPFTREFEAEAETLRLYDGDGAVRLHDLDVEHRALLLERAEPGRDLWQLENEERQIEVAASLMGRLWRPPPAGCSLPRAREYYERMAASLPGLAPEHFPADWPAMAMDIFAALEAAGPAVVLHEDLHQANILAAEREPWLAIDPHGLIGPRELDTTQMILNVVWREPNARAWPRIISRYSRALSEAAGLDAEQIRLCGFARAVLEVFWTSEDCGDSYDRDVAVAEAFAAAK